nr:RNA-directed DNA polymerase, eukaryota, reverse transcriptase zinc-binding domain protein [Tanacetum cinerariifolium]
KNVKVVYDWKPLVCNDCGVFGHADSSSYKKEANKAASSVDSKDNAKEQTEEPLSHVSKEVNDGFAENPVVNLLKEDVGNVPVWVKLHGVLVTDFSEDGLIAIATGIGTPLMLDSYTSDMYLQSWGRSSYVRAMIELRADEELKNTIVVAMPKITRDGYYMCTVHVEYEWKPPRCSCCKVFGHTQEECPKNIGVGVAKNLKKPSQTSRGVSVGPNVGFKPHKEYRHAPKKAMLTLATIRRKNIENSSINTTPNIDKIGKYENLIIDGQAILVVENGNPLKKVEYSGDHDSEDEVASVDNDMAHSMDLEKDEELILYQKAKVKWWTYKRHMTLEMAFLEDILRGFGFHGRMVDWVMKCVTTTSFSICINGESCGYCKGGRGLRQGDPMSPYLFTLVMEILTLLIKRKVEQNANFQYHFGCKRLKITNVCFVDDLLMFCHANKIYVSILKDAIDEFGRVVDLIQNYNKITIIFDCLNKEDKQEMLEVMPFKVEKLPIRYLDVPFTSKRIKIKECKSLIDKEAINSIFGGNDESKKMQKYLLKQQFEGFSVSTSKGLHKGCDRFQTLLSQLDIHGAGVSQEDANQSTNDVSTAYSVSSPFVLKSQKEGSSSYIDKVIHSFFANQSSALQLDYDDLEQINDDDIEEMDLKWQVAMISMRIKKFHKRTRHFARDCRAKRNQDSRRRDAWYNGNKTRDNGRKPAYQDDSKALVTIDGEDIDWSGHVEDDTQNYAMMAYSSSNSGSDNEQNQLAYEQKIRFMKIDLDDKIDVLAYHKKLLAEALKEKEDLKTKFENWQNSSKTLSRLLNTQISANDKFGLGYGDYRYGSILSYENEVLQSVFMNKASDLEYTPINDRYAEGMHAVPPLMTGNYIPSGPDVEIDYSKFTYGPKQTSADKSDSKPSEYASCESDSSVETSTSMPEPVENASKVVCKTKVWTDAPIIEEYESDSDNDLVSNVQEDKEKPSFAFTDSVKHDDPHRALKDKEIIDSGCFRHMTENKAHLVDYQEFKGATVAFGGSNGRITGKGKIKAGSRNQANKSASPKEANNSACTQANDDQRDKIEKNTAFQTCEKPVSQVEQVFLSKLEKLKRQENEANDAAESLRKEATHDIQNANTSSTNLLNTVSTPLSTTGPSRAFNDGELSYPDDTLMSHLEDIYTSPSERIFTDSSYDDEGVVTDFNNLETTEIWLRVQQMMKGSDIGIQEKNAKLFNEWERFTSNEAESIESYYHRFLKLMNDLKRNKHFPEKIASNLKFLNNLQPEWSRYVTIVHQTKDLHTADYTQLAKCRESE